MQPRGYDDAAVDGEEHEEDAPSASLTNEGQLFP
jgi:hypothetical protein